MSAGFDDADECEDCVPENIVEFQARLPVIHARMEHTLISWALWSARKETVIYVEPAFGKIIFTV